MEIVDKIKRRSSDRRAFMQKQMLDIKEDMKRKRRDVRRKVRELKRTIL